MDYEVYEAECEKQIKRNDGFLDQFCDYLDEKGLTTKTINRHLSNVAFYLNNYLLREEPLSMEAGCSYYISAFLGDFFIRKCMWSTPATIKTTAGSIKKYYKWLAEIGHLPQESYKELAEICKDEMEYWIDQCEFFNDSSNHFMF